MSPYDGEKGKDLAKEAAPKRGRSAQKRQRPKCRSLKESRSKRRPPFALPRVVSENASCGGTHRPPPLYNKSSYLHTPKKTRWCPSRLNSTNENLKPSCHYVSSLPVSLLLLLPLSLVFVDDPRDPRLYPDHPPGVFAPPPISLLSGQYPPRACFLLHLVLTAARATPLRVTAGRREVRARGCVVTPRALSIIV